METIVKKLYEAMFLVDSADAASDWDGVNAAIEKVLKRADAEDVSMRKWDDRKLEYDIKGKSRGTYILCYFSCDGDKVGGIEREVQLSEKIMRVLILSAEKIPAEYMEKDTPVEQAEKVAAESAEKAAEKEAKAAEEAAEKEAKAAEEAAAKAAAVEETPAEEAVVEEVPVVEEAAVVEDDSVEKAAVVEESPVEEAPAEEAAEAEDK